MQVLEYLRKQGYRTISSDFYAAILGWDSWYQSDVKKFHSYKIYNGKKFVRKQRKTLSLAKKVSEDIADLLLNEKVEIILNDNATQRFVDSVLANNNFEVMGNTAQEWKSALGTVAYVPYVQDLKLEKGAPVSGKIVINYIPAEKIYPLSWKNCNVLECAFGSDVSDSKESYLHLQSHVFEDGQYVIKNQMFNTTNGKFDEVSLNSVKGYENVAKEIKTGSDKPQFVIDRLNIANNYEKLSPMGVSLFANSLDVLMGIDLVYDSYCTEFDIGRKRIFVRPEMMSLDEDGVTGFDSNATEFYMLPEEAGGGDTFLKEVNMELRSDAHSKAINDNLNLLSEKIGFGSGYYKFEKGVVQTATQVISEDSELFRSIKKHEIILKTVLEDLIKIIIKLGRAYLGMSNLNPDPEIIINFDDSIIEDKQAEFNRDIMLLSSNIIRRDEMRAKHMHETDEEAKKNLPSETKSDLDNTEE